MLEPMQKKSLIVGVDGSEGSRAAVDEAIDLAGALDATVTFAFVRKPPSGWLGDPYYQRALTGDLAKARLAVAQAVETATRAGIEADAEILEGDPADELLSLADNRDVDLIVVGSRGHGPLAGAVLGSVSQSVSQHASRTVVVAKQRPARARQVA
jgi:nucleotide-binding universal stress UspA family protein